MLVKEEPEKDTKPEEAESSSCKNSLQRTKKTKKAPLSQRNKTAGVKSR